MIYAFDLDGTLCSTSGNDYRNSVPCADRIEIINKLYGKNRILIYTARGCVSGLTDELINLTKGQLADWGIKHHELVMGKKINFDLLIDDKAVMADDWFKAKTEKKVGFVASSFDLIHPGYIRLFKDAKTVCNYLICALHADPSVERSTKLTPVNSFEERKEILESIKFIDEIVSYETEYDLIELLKTIQPDVRILGSDYRNVKYTGHNLNIPIHWHERNHEYSTTNLKKNITRQGIEYGLERT